MKIRNYQENIFFVFSSFLLAPFFYGRIALRRKNKPLRFLVIQTAKIGDLVCSSPVFREIKKHYPESHLAVLVIPRAKGVILNNPYIDEIILIDRERYSGIIGVLRLINRIRKEKFDWSFSLVPGVLNTVIPFWAAIPNRVATTSRHTTRGPKIISVFDNHRLEYQKHTLALRHYLKLLKFIGIEDVNEKKDVFINNKDKEKALSFLEELNLKTDDFLIGISVTAGNIFKEWPLDKFAQLSDKLVDQFNAKIIFMGAAHERDKIIQAQTKMARQSFDASQYFSLSEVPALFSRLKLFISVDTGSLYIANAMGIPVVDIAGPIDIYEQPPLGDKCEIVRKELYCSPCSFVLPPARYCKEGHCRCIGEITVADVYQAVIRLKER